MPAPIDVQTKTLRTFVDAWTQWDVTAYLEVLDKDFVQVMMPINMGIPPRSRAEVEQLLPTVMGVVKNFKLSIHQILHDADKGKAAIHSRSTGETPFGPWTNESSIFVTFSETGTKVSSLEEMMDSAWMASFYPKFSEYLKTKETTTTLSAGSGNA